MKSLTLTFVMVLLPVAIEAQQIDGAGVMPLQLPEQTSPEVREIQGQLYRFAQNQARDLLATVRPWADDPTMKLLTEGDSGEHSIRLNTCAVQGFAFLYRFGPYNEKMVGVSREELLQKTIIPMVRYLTATHVTGTRPTSDGRKWGDHWQSAYWAQMIGRAAWWIWDDLPDDLRQAVRRTVAHEADRFVNAKPPHQVKRDTKAEENAWNSIIFDVAVVLMPAADPRRPAWEKAFQRWAISSNLRAADEHSEKLVDGRPVAEQFTGANIHDDFTLENHGMVHPDYMGAFAFVMQCGLDYAMSGREPPEAMFHNAREIYENLKWFYLPDGGCVYPNGEDWALFQIPHFPDTHIQMALYTKDPDAWSLVKDCLATTAKMQARQPEGPIYVSDEIYYPGSPHILLEELSREWLMLQGAKEIVDRPKRLQGIKRLDSGKIILHRTPKAIHTVSWGAVIMAQCVPLRLDRLVSPDKENGVGHIRLEKAKGNLPVRLESANVIDRPDGFTAALVIQHGNSVRAELEFVSHADGTFVAREKLTALKDITTSEIATGLIGVLNNPRWVYESHRRQIGFDDGTTDVPALSGKEVKGDSVRRIDVDGSLQIESLAPLSARYFGTKAIDRGRATDMLYLNYLEGRRAWKAGEVISSYEVKMMPEGAEKK